MQVIGLPGRHPDTEPWLRSVLLTAGLPAGGVARYRHWVENFEASVSYEAQRLDGLAPSLVVAKSFGTRIAAAAFVRNQFRPRAAVLIGTPYQAIEFDDVALLQQFANAVETLFVQQAEDPGGSSADLASSLQLSRADVVSVPGGDHMYSDIAAVAAIIRDWSNDRFQLAE